MKRRLLIALVLLALLLAPAATTAPVALAGDGAGCDFGFQGGATNQGYLLAPESNVWETMVQADIYADTNRFDPCDNPILGDHGGILQWVAIAFPGHVNAIVQVGIIKCNQVNGSNPPSWDACSSSHVGTLNYFYAYGHDDETSCGWGDKLPEPIFLGVVPAAPAYHNFKVQYKTATDRIWFLIDGTLVANISAGAYCFINSVNSRAYYSVERWDTQDGVGTTCCGPAHFDNTRYEKNDDGVTRVAQWLSATSCVLNSEFSCQKYGSGTWSDHFMFWAN